MKRLIFILSLLLSTQLSFGQASGKVISNKPTGGTISLDTINLYSQLNVKQTTAGQTITVANLVTGGKLIYIRNVGSVDFILSPGGNLSPGHGVLLGWTGLVWNVTGQDGNGLYLPLVGGNMTGDINFVDENEGITWDSGSIIYGNGAGLFLNDNINSNFYSTSSSGVEIHASNPNAYLSIQDNTTLNDGSGDYLQLENGVAYLRDGSGDFLRLDAFGFELHDLSRSNIVRSTSTGVDIYDGIHSQIITLGSSGIVIDGIGVNASTVPYLDASKNIKSSTITPTELGYLSGTTSNIQTQINTITSAGSNYVKRDGTTPLTADWAVGTFGFTGVKSIGISGTIGSGYVEFGQQAVNPTAPSSPGFRFFANSSGSPSWVKKNGSDTYVRQFSSTNTADRTYTLQDNSYTIAGTDITQTFTANQIISPSSVVAGTPSLTASLTSNATSGSIIGISSGTIGSGFNPTSGTATNTAVLANPVINQTGTSIGTIRGFHYSPTTTSVLGTHYSFESTSGNMLVGGAGTYMLNDAGTAKTALDVSASNTLRVGNGFTSLNLLPSAVTFATGAIATANTLDFRTGALNSNNITLSRVGSMTLSTAPFTYLVFNGTYAPTASGVGSLIGISFNNVINQTGTANQPVTFVDVSPVLTATLGSIYGVRSRITDATNRWNIYADGTASNYFAGKITQDATITSTGTTGNRTINKPTGTVNIAATGTTVTVTNSFCTTSSIVWAVIRTNDATAFIKNVVPGSGTFDINLGAAATAEVSIGFQVIN